MNEILLVWYCRRFNWVTLICNSFQILEILKYFSSLSTSEELYRKKSFEASVDQG